MGSSRKKKPTITISSSSNGSDSRMNADKPDLPDDSLKVGVYVKTAMMNLQETGYTFTPEQIALFGSVDGSKQYTTRNLSLFYMLKEGETRETVDDPSAKHRYWKDVFVFGEYRFLMYSQWYNDRKFGATKNEFIEWYKTL